ncbi:MAG TPA: tRNA 2-thiouridine(34) synthase MnmA [Actinomycetes bacterium]|nr:tRNA 2-thiouridine(34) synthase MnmA [Actinomycetes bacterium]
MRVVAALSGGVDSAVAAARAVDAGHEVVGVHLALSTHPQSFRSGARGCCSLEDSRDARRVADVLDIPFYVWDFAERFRVDVLDDFVAEYAAGRTPNPCVRCNERIKFVAVLERALALDFDAICTGHYARIVPGDEGPELHRAVDHAKDQSYVLAMLAPHQLSRVLFPLGDAVKAEVRAEADRRGLLVADKPDSHDICFIPDGDTRGFLQRHLGERPGVIVDESGAELARHDGAWGVTVGQRHGLGVGTPAVDGAPRYVLSIEPVTRTVTMGPRELLSVTVIECGSATWCGPAMLDGSRRDVQWRAHGESVSASVAVDRAGQLSVTLDQPAEAVAPGQTLVVYDGSRVVGSATVAAARPAELAAP